MNFIFLPGATLGLTQIIKWTNFVTIQLVPLAVLPGAKLLKSLTNSS